MWENSRTKNEASKTPVLTGNPCKEFPEKTTWSHLLFKNKEIRPPTWLKILQDLILWKRPAFKLLLKPLDVVNAAAQVALNLFKTLAITSTTTSEWYTVKKEDI